ncbi:helix-turn-helix domain-containing protein (plasmid) [Halobaculum sp. CBA1158]|uniref:winged helix-turn-helix domain-containing protein n=1 Tax=Halobaculum sp. CBA1158 TaxID=2904243 RepID=UPI001F25152F|nr:helix-turn-helix domain-containing protein [Halobaculum sp. CBA1158]UIP01332.1 helix-turn-helix domain-containing protein [Halobaculum sp. CBA1158]
MTRSTASEPAGSIDAPVVSATPREAARLFDALDSEACRTVVRALEDGPMTAKELQQTGDIPLSTVYRCVNELVDTPLVEETTRVSEGGHHASEYSRPVEALVVALDDESAFRGSEESVLRLTL